MKPSSLSVRVLLLLLLALMTAVASARRRGGGNNRRPPPSSSSSEEADDGVDEVGAPAMLTPLLEAGRVAEAVNASRTEPPLLGDLESYSGFLTVDAARGAHLFFWFFPAERGGVAGDAPLVLWLQGGPGSSALLGVFLEHGPLRLKRKGRRLKRRRHAWTRAASVLYVDSPAGTGFSFAESPSGLVTSSEQAGRDLLAALRQFLALFPELRDNEFFIAGESYAGKYAPALAVAIHTANSAAAPADRINLQGLAVGNPLADPEAMLDYGDYLYQIGLVDGAGRQRFRQREDAIRDLVRQQRWADAWRERDALIGRPGGGNNGTTLFRDLTGYRFRFNYLHDVDYLNRAYKQLVQEPSFRRLLHVGNLTYHNRSAVAERLRDDVMQSARPWYEVLVEHYDVLFYNGQLDVADPYPLMVSFIERMRWSGADAYRAAERRLWMVDGELAGYAKSAGRLTEVLVRAAGHMVPADQPKWALDLITKFVSHKPVAM